MEKTVKKQKFEFKGNKYTAEVVAGEETLASHKDNDFKSVLLIYDKDKQMTNSMYFIPRLTEEQIDEALSNVLKNPAQYVK